MNSKFALLFALLLPVVAVGQSTMVPLNEDYYHWVDRYEVKYGRISPALFSGIKPYKRSQIVAFLDSMPDLMFTSRADQFNREFLQNDSWEWSGAATADSKKPVLKHFYRKQADLFHVEEDWFDLHVNPVLHLAAGKDSRRNDDMLFINTRGVEIRGMIDRKVGFYTYLADNQMIMPSYADELFLRRHLAVPHEGFWKGYKRGPGVDFLHARGYLTVEATRHINVQFGHDRNFIGHGYRSLVFSDFAPPTWFIKANLKVWKLNYLFLVNQMIADVTGNVSGLTAMDNGYPLKYNALHHLSVNIGKKLTLGVFETVIFSPDDPNGTDYFRLDYLNPIIFYRAVEQQNGSSDNVMLGADFRYIPVRKLSLYGQFVLDEFVVDEIRSGNGWWANKFAVQVGGKWVDAFGVPNLDLQGELNIVRPYTYSHGSTFGNYSNYRQPIGHPIGANFHEAVGILRYQPVPRLNVTGKLILVKTGRDPVNENWGGDILKSNRSLQQNYGNKIGQGAANDIVFGSFTASWHLKHNLFIDGNIVVRRSESDLAAYKNNTNVLSMALRWNIAQRLYEF